jgi:hypothetical protein
MGKHDRSHTASPGGLKRVHGLDLASVSPSHADQKEMSGDLSRDTSKTWAEPTGVTDMLVSK